MRTSKWLVAVAGITLLHLAWTATMTAAPARIASDPWMLFGLGFLTLLLLALTPVFFAALYLDAGHVRESASPWNPDRRLWVGGGIAACVVAYALVHAFVVGFVGAAYLFRRLQNPAPTTLADATESDEVATDESDERSVGGIAVHLLALPTSVLGAGLVYATSDDRFTRENARHALNWHCSVVALTLGSYLLLALGSDSGSFLGQPISGPILPPPLNVFAFVVGGPLVVASVAVWGVTVVFAVVAAVKAGLGSPWRYPLAYGFVDRDT